MKNKLRDTVMRMLARLLALILILILSFAPLCLAQTNSSRHDLPSLPTK
jgi:hypothetical protein